MRIEFKNFRCLRDTALDLTPLTVIVGPNASGKSSILQALDPGFIPQREDVYQRNVGLGCTITRSSPSGTAVVSTVDTSGGPRIHKSDLRYFYQCLRLNVDSLRNPNEVMPESVLGLSGGNLANVFDTLDRGTQASLVKDFCDLVPVFSDVNAIPLGSGRKHLVFTDRWSNSVKYVPTQVSDGSMLVLALLTLRYQLVSPDVLAIEELERGLHPYLIQELVSFLRRLATGELGGKVRRIVLATHSPEVLSCARPEEVRVLKRSADGSVDINSLDTNATSLKQALDVYEGSLGGLWLSGNLGGVPGAA